MTKPYSTNQFSQQQPATAQHIAVLVHSLNPGGAQRRLVALANAFVEAGREVDFIALRGGGDVDSLLDPRVRFTILSQRPKPIWKPWFFEGWGELRSWLGRRQPDVLLAGITTVHHSALRACGSLKQRPPVLVLRGSRHPARDFPWSRPFKRLLEPFERATRRRIYGRADLVIAVSKETADALRSDMRDQKRVVEIANPVISPAFVQSLANDAPHPWLLDEAPVIVGVGRLAWQKRFDVLIEAVAAVRRKRDIRLIILGEGRMRSKLEARIRRLGLADAVAMPGWVDDVGAWISRSRMLVSTSAFEGSPAVLIEALAAGVPVVATACPGGSEELLAGGKGGILVPLNDPAATADAILELVDRPRQAEALKKLVPGYTVEASAAAYLETLDRVFSNSARTAGTKI